MCAFLLCAPCFVVSVLPAPDSPLMSTVLGYAYHATESCVWNMRRRSGEEILQEHASTASCA